MRIETGKVIADPVETLWLPPEVAWLDDQIEQRIPLVELVDPLIDINSWIGFAEHFVHAGGARRRMPDFLPRLFAVLIAYATNLGGPARSTKPGRVCGSSTGYAIARQCAELLAERYAAVTRAPRGQVAIAAEASRDT
ncbi:MAG: Tn3 family transposase [Solirubrobacteraceae bacterium]